MTQGIETKNPLTEVTKLWADLNTCIDRNHRLFPDYNKVAAKANSYLRRAQELFGKIEGAPKLEDADKELQELYKQAVEIRASMLLDTIASAARLPKGTTMDTATAKSTDAITDLAGSKEIGKKLASIAAALSIDPSVVLSGASVPQNWFYQKYNNNIAPRMDKVNEARAFINDVRKQGVARGMETMLRQLEAGLQQVEKLNPVFTKTYQWAKAYTDGMNKMDTKPLRILTGIGGGLLAGVGLTYNAFTKTMPTWPTYMWAGITAFSFYPDMLKGGAARELEKFAKLGGNGVRDVLNAFKGSDGVKAFNEMLSATKDPNKMKVWNTALKTGSVTPSLIGVLTDGKKTPLAAILLKLKDNAKTAVSFFSNLSTSDARFIEEQLAKL